MRNTTNTIPHTAANYSEVIKEKVLQEAYFLAEQRGFAGDYQLHDWLEAEAKVHHRHGKVC